MCGQGRDGEGWGGERAVTELGLKKTFYFFFAPRTPPAIGGQPANREKNTIIIYHGIDTGWNSAGASGVELQSMKNSQSVLGVDARFSRAKWGSRLNSN